MDNSIRAGLEPGSADSAERFQVLKEFRKTNAITGLHVMPIVPFITDTEENFESMFALARDCGVDYVLPGTLYLKGDVRLQYHSLGRAIRGPRCPGQLCLFPVRLCGKLYWKQRRPGENKKHVGKGLTPSLLK